jgi:hypothetical protein
MGLLYAFGNKKSIQLEEKKKLKVEEKLHHFCDKTAAGLSLHP